MADPVATAAHPLAFLTRAKAACEAARWPEQHRDDCAWCAYCRDLRRMR